MIKKNIKKILRIVYWILLIVLSFFNIFTIFNKIPAVGEIATIAFIPIQSILVIINIVFLILTIIYLILRKGLRYKIYLIVAIILSLLTIYINANIISSVNSQGEKISFLTTFTSKDFSNVTVDTKEYTDVNGSSQKLNIYSVNDGNDSKPVIIYTHGGGWTNGTREDHEDLTKSLAQNGYVVVSLEYDLSSEDKHLWDSTEEQLCYGIIWVNNNISNYNGNIDKTYMIGDSAGGNLALDISYKINYGTYKKIGTEELPKISAVSVIYPAVNIKDLYNGDSLLFGSLVKGLVTNYIGGSPDEYPERYEQNCQSNYINKDTPATMIVSANCDSYIPHSSTKAFVDLLDEEGIEYQYIDIPYGNHLGDSSITNLMGQTYLNNTLKWFAEH